MSNGIVITVLTAKGVERERTRSNLYCWPGICLKGQWTTEKSSHTTRSPGQNLKSGPSAYGVYACMHTSGMLPCSRYVPMPCVGATIMSIYRKFLSLRFHDSRYSRNISIYSRNLLLLEEPRHSLQSSNKIVNVRTT